MEQYTPGSKILFEADFRTAEGQFQNATNARVHFVSAIGGVSEVALTQIATGQYSLLWTIPADAAVGFYGFYTLGVVSVKGVDTEAKGSLEYFEVVPLGASDDDLPQGLYCTVADVKNRLPLLDATDANIMGHIEDAQTEIDAALLPIYVDVPFATVPAHVRSICKDLATASILDYITAGDGSAEKNPLSQRLLARGREKLGRLSDRRDTLPLAYKQRVKAVLSNYDSSGTLSALRQLIADDLEPS